MSTKTVTLFEFSRSNTVVHREMSRIPITKKDMEPVFDVESGWSSTRDSVDIEYWPVLTLRRMMEPNDTNEEFLKRCFPDLTWTPHAREGLFGKPMVLYETNIAIDYNFHELIKLHIDGTVALERRHMEVKFNAARDREKKWESKYKALNNSVATFETQPWYIRVWAALKGDIRGL